MNVDMRNSLACCYAVVEPNVESIGMVLFDKAFADSFNQIPQSKLLVLW